MLKTTFGLLLFGYVNSMTYMKCPEGTGTDSENCCVIKPTSGKQTMISIPNTIKCAIVDCSDKACHKNVQVFTGADETTFKCNSADTCTASQFVCGRGAPGSDMRDYENNGKCILEATVGSSAKELDFAVFGNMKAEVQSMSDVSFGTGGMRCFGAGCTFDCATSSSCKDTAVSGSYDCTGAGCEGFKEDRYEGFPPIVATPDSDGNCEIKPVRGTLSALVFKNNCKQATLNCNEASLCEKRKIYSAAEETTINCGGPDPTKTDGTRISGACKEAFMYIGPLFMDELPHNTDERDFDVGYSEGNTLTGERGNIKFNKATINYIGSDAGSKNKVKATMTHLTINTDGGSSFSDASYQCGSQGGSNVAGTNCQLNCMTDLEGKPSCVFCKRTTMDGSQYSESLNNEAQTICLDANTANRIGLKQSTVNSQSVSDSNTVNASSSEIVLPVKSLYAFAIIFAVIVLGVIIGCHSFKSKKYDQRSNLIKYGAMELESVQNKA